MWRSDYPLAGQWTIISKPTIGNYETLQIPWDCRGMFTIYQLLQDFKTIHSMSPKNAIITWVGFQVIYFLWRERSRDPRVDFIHGPRVGFGLVARVTRHSTRPHLPYVTRKNNVSTPNAWQSRKTMMWLERGQLRKVWNKLLGMEAVKKCEKIWKGAFRSADSPLKRQTHDV